ncbi:MAG TPA: hypothetical protein PLI09_01110 [Candidatus Hydrogenedentes bacterium]|nr:hypothetical protein [Candidatus Hydrogenedentota bacterium]
MYGVYNPVHIFEFRDKPLPNNVLQFNPVQIGEWLTDLLVRKAGGNKTELSRYLGMSRTRVVQCLVLAELPVNTRSKLRQKDGLNEYQVREGVTVAS